MEILLKIINEYEKIEGKKLNINQAVLIGICLTTAPQKNKIHEQVSKKLILNALST